LAAADPGNAEAQRDLSISHDKLGDVAARTGDTTGAADHYRAALAITERLAAADPGNAEAQRDLSVSYSKLGDLATETGDGLAAADHYRAALAIIEPLVDTDTQASEFAYWLRQRLEELLQESD
jgi:Flp pilus assembly protein TadD